MHGQGLFLRGMLLDESVMHGLSKAPFRKGRGQNPCNFFLVEDSLLAFVLRDNILGLNHKGKGILIFTSHYFCKGEILDNNGRINVIFPVDIPVQLIGGI